MRKRNWYLHHPTNTFPYKQHDQRCRYSILAAYSDLHALHHKPPPDADADTDINSPSTVPPAPFHFHIPPPPPRPTPTNAPNRFHLPLADIQPQTPYPFGAKSPREVGWAGYEIKPASAVRKRGGQQPGCGARRSGVVAGGAWFWAVRDEEVEVTVEERCRVAVG